MSSVVVLVHYVLKGIEGLLEVCVLVVPEIGLCLELCKTRLK